MPTKALGSGLLAQTRRERAVNDCLHELAGALQRLKSFVDISHGHVMQTPAKLTIAWHG